MESKGRKKLKEEEKITPISDEHWKKLTEKFSFSSVNDLTAGTVNKFTIQFYCNTAARKILEAFANSDLETLTLMQYIAESLMLIAQEKEPNNAFKYKKNHKPHNDTAHDKIIALLAWCAIKDGITCKAAFIDVAKKRCLSSKTVSRFYYLHRKELESAYQEILQESTIKLS